jgi:hypothetical protein
MSSGDARALGQLVSDVDKLNDNGTLGSVLNADSQQPDHAYMHSMCQAGGAAAACVSATADFIEKSFAMKSMQGLAQVLHAEQDYLAPGHQMKQYDGSVGVGHIVRDIGVRSPQLSGNAKQSPDASASGSRVSLGVKSPQLLGDAEQSPNVLGIGQC